MIRQRRNGDSNSLALRKLADKRGVSSIVMDKLITGKIKQTPYRSNLQQTVISDNVQNFRTKLISSKKTENLDLSNGAFPLVPVASNDVNVFALSGVGTGAIQLPLTSSFADSKNFSYFVFKWSGDSTLTNASKLQFQMQSSDKLFDLTFNNRGAVELTHGMVANQNKQFISIEKSDMNASVTRYCLRLQAIKGVGYLVLDTNVKFSLS